MCVTSCLKATACTGQPRPPLTAGSAFTPLKDLCCVRLLGSFVQAVVKAVEMSSMFLSVICHID